MKILFDHQIFTLQKHGGISRYFIQLILNLPEIIEKEIAIYFSDNEYLIDAKIVDGLRRNFKPDDKFFNGFKFCGKDHLFKLSKKLHLHSPQDCYLRNQQLSIERLKIQDFDIFHPTYYDDYFLEYIGDKPFILTIHDMIHELYPEMLNDSHLSQRKAKLAQKAAHIIAVSENTKKDVVNILGIPEYKISVIYHSHSLSEESINIPLPDKYLLFVGERSFYKNFKFFLHSISSVLKETPNLYLVCAGKPFNEDEKVFLKDLAVSEQVIAKSVDDKELHYLYKNAIALVFPSYYEGFGIPILEAFQTGCPVVLSNSSCFNEIASDAGLYFDPKNAENIRSTIKNLLINNNLRKLQISKGFERVNNFSWKISALDTANLYYKLL